MEDKLEEILNRHPRENKLKLVSILEEMSKNDIFLSIPAAICISKHTNASVSDIYALCKTTFARILEKNKAADIEICCGSNCYFETNRKLLQKLQLPSNALSLVIDQASDVKLSIKKCCGRCNEKSAISVNVNSSQYDMLNSVINREIKNDL